MKTLVFPFLILILGTISAKCQTKIPYSRQDNSLIDKSKVFLSPKTKKHLNGQKNGLKPLALIDSKKEKILISEKDNMPCLIPEGNFNMPVMKIDSVTKYKMRTEKIK